MRNGISWMIRSLGSSLVVFLAVGSAGAVADVVDIVDVAGEDASGERGFSSLFISGTGSDLIGYSANIDQYPSPPLSWEHAGFEFCGSVYRAHVIDSKSGNRDNFCSPVPFEEFVPGSRDWRIFKHGIRGRQFHGNGNEANAVPEPGSLALLGIGLIGIGVTRRRRID